MGPLNRRPFLAIMASVALAVGIAAVPASADTGTTRYVAPDGSGGGSCATPNANTIQGAVDASSPGDTILVCPGTYREIVQVTTPRLTIRATKPWKAVLKPPVFTAASGLRREAAPAPRRAARYGHPSSAAGVSPADGIPLLTIQGADGVHIQWLLLTAPTTGACDRMDTMIAVTQGSDNVVIRANRIRPEGADTTGPCGYGFGILMIDGSSAWIGYNLITNFQDTGVELEGAGTAATVVHNSVRFRHSDGLDFGGWGIGVESGAWASIRHNAVVGLGSAIHGDSSILNVAIFTADAADDVVVRANLVKYAEYGVVIFSSTDHAVVRDNTLAGFGENGMDINAVVGAHVIDNRVQGAHGFGVAVIEDSSASVLRHNDLRTSQGLDCNDETSGAGTSGTASTWTDDLGNDANVAGICQPGVVPGP